MNAPSLKTARAKVNSLTFGTPEWETAMETVRALVAEENKKNAGETFCSIDSGVHPTRLSDGRIINA